MATKPLVGMPAPLMLSFNEYGTDGPDVGQNIPTVNIDGITLIYQGATGIPGNTKTYFGKRHLLFFKGGNADARRETFNQKAGRVFGKRLAHHVNYGTAEPQVANTMIVVDQVGSAKMDRAFAKGVTKHAKSTKANKKIQGGMTTNVFFNAQCVHSFDKTGNITASGDGVRVVYINDGANYAIVHLEALLTTKKKPGKKGADNKPGDMAQAPKAKPVKSK